MVRRLMCLVLLAAALHAFGAQQSSITQGNVTWHFASACEVGQFASGDWWVLAPVVITSIDPPCTSGYNGWEINPVPNVAAQGFDKEFGGYTGGNVPALPCTMSAGTRSVVKAVSSAPGATRRIASVKVLTIVSAVPPGNGTEVFRPPYAGTSKPFYQVSAINWALLPAFAPVTAAPTLATVAQNFANTNLAHLTSARYLRPVDAVPDDYQPANCPSSNEAVLRLMLNDSQSSKQAAMINVLQRGIDEIQWQIAGNVQPNSGHMPGLITIPSFTAVMLDIAEYKIFLNTLTTSADRQNFEEFQYIKTSDRDSTLSLWGQNSAETNYWNYIMRGDGNRSNRDPYHYIDGGTCGDAYQLITINGHKGEVLSAILMPAVGAIYEPGFYRRLVTYVDRMMSTGTWAQPDPCAPFDGDTANYRVTYGPDPGNPGRCIRDPDLEYYNSPTDYKCRTGATCGRYPAKHGSKSGWQYNSNFVTAMWNAYRGTVGIDRIKGAVAGINSDMRPIVSNNPLGRNMSLVMAADLSGDRSGQAIVLDMQGTAVRNLPAAGNGPITWDGNDDRGTRVRPGCHIVRLYNGQAMAAAQVIVLD